MAEIRLNRFLATYADLSRRKADDAILANRVKVNNKVAQLGTTIHPDFDEVTLDGQVVRRQRFEYLAFHKPKGVITSKGDPHERKTIYSVLPEKYHHLKTAGRLDRNTTGLLILSNDGDFLNALIHPQKSLKKIYRLKLNNAITEKDLEKLEKGIELQPEGKTAYLQVEEWREPNVIVVSTHTGYNRQLRRMAEALGYDVTDLKRLAIGPIHLKSLAVGQVRPLTPTEKGRVIETNKKQPSKKTVTKKTAKPVNKPHKKG